MKIQPLRMMAGWLCLIALLHSPSLLAWGHTGHAIIGAIADAHLNPTAKAAVAHLLQQDNDADGNPSGNTTLASVASWADDWRATAEGKHTARWHYEDRPVCQPGAVAPCPRQQCIHAALLREIQILRDPQADLTARNQALKWIVHLVGDLHQPLHVSDHEDRGGNQLQILTLEHHKVSLHHYWDTLVVHEIHVATDTPLPQGYLPGSIADWFNDSYRLALLNAYGQLPGFHCTGPLEEPVQITTAYDQMSQRVVREQLQQAGFRLAMLLNQLIGAAKPSIALN